MLKATNCPGGELVLDDQVAAGQQGDDHGNAQDEFERGPEHAHELNEPQGAGDVFAVEAFEEADLRLFAGKGAHQAGAGVVLLGMGGNFGEAGLDALEAVMDLAAEILGHDAGQRARARTRPGSDRGCSGAGKTGRRW